MIPTKIFGSAVLLLRWVLHRIGFDLVRWLDDGDLLKRRIRLMASRNVEVVFDVGAHAGQYGQTLRALGYKGRLVSFEPLPGPFSLLQRASADDPLWDAVNVALGDREGEVTMHVAGNSQSSSVLEMLPSHELAAPGSAYADTSQVRMTTLENMIKQHAGQRRSLFVKVDAQGYEEQVIGGAGEALRGVVGLQLEMSLIPLYQGQALLDEMIRNMRDLGFTLMSLEPGFSDPRTGQLLQADGIFFRS